MDSKRMLMILPGVVGAGFCVIEAVKLAFPPVSAGRAEGWMMTLGIITGSALLLAAFMLFAQWRGGDPRRETGARPSRHTMLGRAR